MKYLNAAIGMLLLSVAGTVVAAQPPQQQSGEYAPPNPAQQQDRAQQPPVSDEKLQQYADAMDEIRSVQQEYSEAIQEAENMEDAQTLRADAQEEMRGAVQKTGLSVSEYNMISQRLQSDPSLIQRLDDIRAP